MNQKKPDFSVPKEWSEDISSVISDLEKNGKKREGESISKMIGLIHSLTVESLSDKIRIMMLRIRLQLNFVATSVIFFSHSWNIYKTGEPVDLIFPLILYIIVILSEEIVSKVLGIKSGD